MPTRFIQRRSTLAPGDVSLPEANAIFIDSDDNELKFTTGTSGTTTVEVVTESQTQTLTSKTFTAPTINNPIVDLAVTDLTTGNLTLTAAAHGGGIITVNDADSANTVTLPLATGTGVRFEVIVGTTVATGTLAIKVVDANHTMRGVAWMATDADCVADSVTAFETLAASDTITLNGTTQGGRSGDHVVLTDIATNVWAVQAFLVGTGVEATPFSATV